MAGSSVTFRTSYNDGRTMVRSKKQIYTMDYHRKHTQHQTGSTGSPRSWGSKVKQVTFSTTIYVNEELTLVIADREKYLFKLFFSKTY